MRASTCPVPPSPEGNELWPVTQCRVLEVLTRWALGFCRSFHTSILMYRDGRNKWWQGNGSIVSCPLDSPFLSKAVHFPRNLGHWSSDVSGNLRSLLALVLQEPFDQFSLSGEVLMCRSRWKEVVSLRSVWLLPCYFQALLSGIHEACVDWCSYNTELGTALWLGSPFLARAGSCYLRQTVSWVNSQHDAEL